MDSVDSALTCPRCSHARHDGYGCGVLMVVGYCCCSPILDAALGTAPEKPAETIEDAVARVLPHTHLLVHDLSCAAAFRPAVVALIREQIRALDEDPPPLHWFDEGDGYQHAYKSMPCDERREDADFVLESERTVMTIVAPPMPEKQARQLVERLFAYATRLLAETIREGGE